jgi:hypothetical protein
LTIGRLDGSVRLHDDDDACNAIDDGLRIEHALTQRLFHSESFGDLAFERRVGRDQVLRLLRKPSRDEGTDAACDAVPEPM